MDKIPQITETDTTEQPCYIELPEGITLYIRKVRISDRECIADGFRRLSPVSRRFRFLSPVSRLTGNQLDYLTDINNKDHCAWGAKDVNENFLGVGIARYIRIEETPFTAEFAVTVVDSYQKKGIGTLLFCLLVKSALKNGITTFTGYCHPENKAISAMLQKFNPEISYHHAFMKMTIPLFKIRQMVNSLLDSSLKTNSPGMEH